MDRRGLRKLLQDAADGKVDENWHIEGLHLYYAALLVEDHRQIRNTFEAYLVKKDTA